MTNIHGWTKLLTFSSYIRGQAANGANVTQILLEELARYPYTTKATFKGLIRSVYVYVEPLEKVPYYQLLSTALHSFSWKSYYWQPEGLLIHCPTKPRPGSKHTLDSGPWND